MPKKTDPNTLPLRIHRPTNQAYVLVDGHRHYLGRQGTPETQVRYDRFIVEWLSNGRRLRVEPTVISIAEMLLRFDDHVQASCTDQRDRDRFKAAITALRELYGSDPAASFGPLKLQAVRERLKAGKHRKRSRGYVNTLAQTVRRIFKWAASQQVIPGHVYRDLETVEGLREGRTDAPESNPVKPVDDADINAIKPFVPKPVWALISLQRLTGARPSELFRLRPIDLKTGTAVWCYELEKHKTSHKGKRRVIFFGQRAQEVIKPFLALPDGTSRPVAKPLFSPAEAMQEMRDKRTAERKKNGTPLNQGNGVGTNRKRNPSKVPGEAYTRHSYHAAITRGCKKAGITPWFPYQIRHAVAEATRERFGIEAASALLGHADVKITQHYAKLQSQKALAVAECVG